MIAALGQRNEPHVALEHDGLGRGGHAGEPEPRRELAFVHHSLSDDVGILGVMHDERVEIARIGQRAAHDLRVGHAFCPIRKGNGARRLEQSDFSHLFSAQPLGERRHRLHVHDRGVARAAEHEVHDRRIVDRWRGVGL